MQHSLFVQTIAFFSSYFVSLNSGHGTRLCKIIQIIVVITYCSVLTLYLLLVEVNTLFT